MERRPVFFPDQVTSSRAMFTQASDEQTQPFGPCFLLQEGFQAADWAVVASPRWGVTKGCSVMTSREDLHASLPQAIQQPDNRRACNYSPFERFLMHLVERHWFFFLVRITKEKRKHLNLAVIPAAWLFTEYSARKVKTFGFSQPNCECNWME